MPGPAQSLPQGRTIKRLMGIVAAVAVLIYLSKTAATPPPVRVDKLTFKLEKLPYRAPTIQDEQDRQVMGAILRKNGLTWETVDFRTWTPPEEWWRHEEARRSSGR